MSEKNTINLKTLTMRNFLSFGNATTEVSFEDEGTVLVMGEDLDHTANGIGANGVGKALPLDSNILTPTGWKKMGDIQQGDVVRTPDGYDVPVRGVYPQGTLNTYEITFRDGRKTITSADHLWKVKSSTTDEWEILSTEQIRQNNPTNFYQIPSVHFETNPIKNKKPPYVVKPYVFGKYIGCGGDHTKFDAAQIHFITNLITKDQAKHYPFIPNNYFHANGVQKQELLFGLFTQIGNVSNTFDFDCESYQLAQDIQRLIHSFGGQAELIKGWNGKRNSNCFVVNSPTGKFKHTVKMYATPSASSFIELAAPYVSFSQIGELEIFLSDNIDIVSIEPCGKQQCQCIYVDHPDHLFVTDDYIVTHNTVILNAISYAMYDKPAVSESSGKDSLINNINRKKMKVTLEFEKGGHHYYIERFRKMKSTQDGTGVKFFINGEDRTRDSKKTNQMIENTIGVPHELFKQIVVFPANTTPFLSLPKSHPTQPCQRSMIEHLFGLTELTHKAEQLKEQKKQTKQDLEVERLRVENAEKEEQNHQQQIDKTKERLENWKQENNNKIEQLQKKLNSIENVDFDKEKQLHEQYDHVKQQRKELLQQINTYNESLEKLEKEQTQLQQEISHLEDEKCPYCLQEYQTSKEKLEESKKRLEQNKSEQNEILNNLSSLESDYNQINDQVKQTADQMTVDDLDTLWEIRNESSQIQEKITDLQQQENPFEGPLQELENNPPEPVDYNELNRLNNLVEHQDMLIKLLTKNDSFVRKVLLNRNLPFLNARLAKYLQDLGLSFKVEFTHNLVANISRFGRELDHGNVSNGQKARINIALSFAFRDVLQKLHSSFNICILDEVLDYGLDSIGITNTAKMLKRKARDEGITIYVISHRDELDNVFDKTKVIQMHKGFSKLIEQ